MTNQSGGSGGGIRNHKHASAQSNAHTYTQQSNFREREISVANNNKDVSLPSHCFFTLSQLLLLYPETCPTYLMLGFFIFKTNSWKLFVCFSFLNYSILPTPSTYNMMNVVGNILNTTNHPSYPVLWWPFQVYTSWQTLAYQGHHD